MARHTGRLALRQNDNVRDFPDSAGSTPSSHFPQATCRIDHGDQRMISPTPMVRAPWPTRFALGAIVVMLLGAPSIVDAQVVQGVQQGAQAGNKAAGPVGGVLGGAIGGVVGVFTGVLGVGKGGQTSAPAAGAGGTKQTGAAKTAKGAKGTKEAKQA